MMRRGATSALLVVALLLAGCNNRDVAVCHDYKVSWMTSWATTGQIMVTLLETDIPVRNRVAAQFPPFLYGPAMNEAALSATVEATNTGIVPTISLLAASDDWTIIARLISFPVALVVPEDSPVRTISDLRGKRIGVPFGGGSHPYILQRLEENGIEAGAGANRVELVNLSPPDQAAAYRSGDVDALATWEPQTAIARAEKPSKVIDRDVHVGFLSLRRQFLDECPAEVARLLRAYREAMFYVAHHREQTDRWFLSVSQFDPTLLDRIEVVEENLDAQTLAAIRLVISPEEISKTQRVADVMYQHDLIPRPVNVASRINQELLVALDAADQ